jgi:heme-degrading monooxygenase HmoA
MTREATMNAGHYALWEFIVQPARQVDFLRHYAPGGTWAELFRQAPGYLGTELLQDRTNPLRYLTIDRWADLDSYRAFRAQYQTEYQALDRACEGLTTQESPLGEYQAGRAAGGG